MSINNRDTPHHQVQLHTIRMRHRCRVVIERRLEKNNRRHMKRNMGVTDIVSARK